MDLISDWRAAMGSRCQGAAVAAFWEAVESGAEELDAMAAGLRAARLDRLCREREERMRLRVPRESTADRLRREEVARRAGLRGWVHPSWESIQRKARRRVARGPAVRGASPWDAAAGRAVALRLPAVVWGQKEGARPEPDGCAHQLQIEGYDAAAELGPWVEATPLDADAWEVEPWIVRAIHGDRRDREGHFGVAGGAVAG